MTGTGLVALLWRYRYRLVSVGLVVAVLALGASKFMAQTFYSEGSLIIENPPSPSSDATSPVALSNAATQVDVLKSRGLVEKVVIALDLVHVPTVEPVSRLPKPVQDALAAVSAQIKNLKLLFSGEPEPATAQIDAVTQYVQKHLNVTDEENSSVITVGYLGGSPKTTADVVNGIINTYLAVINKARDDKVEKNERALAAQKVTYAAAIVAAEAQVNAYARTHNVAEVQGSQTAAMQLSETQKELVVARTKQANAEAAYETAKTGKNGAQEILDSKTIVALKTQEAKLIGDLGTLTSIDPRRKTIEGAIAATRAQIGAETSAIMASLARDVEVAKGNVAALEKLTRMDIAQAQNGSGNSAEFAHLKDGLASERALYAAFLSSAAASRIQAQQAPTAHILFAAFSPEKPAYAYGSMSVILGFFAGFVVYSAVIVLRSLVRPMVTSREEMMASTGLPVFGSLPQVKAGRGGNIMDAPKTAPQVTETIRAFAVTMQPEFGRGVVILVTSGDTKEGKTTVSRALAERYAKDGSRILLIDADLRHPSLARLFNAFPRNGLDTLLRQETVPDTAAIEMAIGEVAPGLDVLCSEGGVGQPMRAIGSMTFAAIVTLARERYDYVIFDSPPVLKVADAKLLAKYADRILFIVQSGRLTQDLVAEATHRFEAEDRNKIVTMLVRVPAKQLQKSDYYGGYVKA